MCRGNRHSEPYNRQIAAQDGYVLLDKDTVRTRRLRGGGLEIADALGPAGQLICVKKADGTAPLNHLFAQGRVAIETLRYDLGAREKFLAKLDELAPGHPLDTSFSSPTLVYGIRPQGRGAADSRLSVRFREGLAAAHGDVAAGDGHASGDRLHFPDEADW
nr:MULTISPECIES: DUF6119 family protein [unclassified Frankia]